jgi:hypothetical protein
LPVLSLLRSIAMIVSRVAERARLDALLAALYAVRAAP